jgi:hypothetical protein
MSPPRCVLSGAVAPGLAEAAPIARGDFCELDEPRPPDAFLTRAQFRTMRLSAASPFEPAGTRDLAEHGLRQEL